MNRTLFTKIRNAIDRPVSLVLALALVLGIIAAVMLVVVPELVNSIQALAEKLPDFLASTQKWIQAQIAVGGTISAIFILIASPNQFFWFLLLFIVLQQIENDLIYPRVVGGSIGLPAIWVLMAVLIGGRLFGVMGILFFIPLFSILYVLMREYIHKRIKLKAESPKSSAD